MSDCFFVILRLNPACPELASRRIRLAKAAVLPFDLSSDIPNDRLVILRLKALDAPDRFVILRLKSPTEPERRSLRWNDRSDEAARLTRVIIESSNSVAASGGREST